MLGKYRFMRKPNVRIFYEYKCIHANSKSALIISLLLQLFLCWLFSYAQNISVLALQFVYFLLITASIR